MIYHNESPMSCEGMIREQIDENIETVAKLLARAIDDGDIPPEDPHALAAMLVGSVHELLHMFAERGDKDAFDEIPAIIDRIIIKTARDETGKGFGNGGTLMRGFLTGRRISLRRASLRLLFMLFVAGALPAPGGRRDAAAEPRAGDRARAQERRDAPPGGAGRRRRRGAGHAGEVERVPAVLARGAVRAQYPETVLLPAGGVFRRRGAAR